PRPIRCGAPRADCSVALCSRRPRAYTANGEEAVMAALGPGDLIGELEVFTAGVRNDPQWMQIADP
ncbi:MAG: hypothetical protein WCP63_09760, partial [Cyanobium sp. ELA712]